MSSAIQETRMAGRSRSKTLVPREPNGRASRRTTFQKEILYAQRIRDAVRKLSKDPFLESPLGLMMLHGEVTSEQYAAGKLFAEAREAADRVLGLPRRHPKGQDVSAAYGALNAPEDVERVRQSQDRYYSAERAVGLNSAPLRALQEIVVYEARPCGPDALDDLRIALTRLAQHWRIK